MACPPTFQPFSADDENPNSFNPGINALENEGAYAIIPDVERLTAEGHTILNFGPGQPDFPTPQHVKDAGCDAIQGNQTTYTNPSGTGDIKAEIAKFMNRTRGLEGEQAVVVRCPAPRGVSLRVLCRLIYPGGGCCCAAGCPSCDRAGRQAAALLRCAVPAAAGRRDSHPGAQPQPELR
jgi:hypothetical protein